MNDSIVSKNQLILLLKFQSTLTWWILLFVSGNGDIQWSFSQVKGTLDDDVTEGKFQASLLLLI